MAGHALSRHLYHSSQEAKASQAHPLLHSIINAAGVQASRTPHKLHRHAGAPPGEYCYMQSPLMTFMADDLDLESPPFTLVMGKRPGVRSVPANVSLGYATCLHASCVLLCVHHGALPRKCSAGRLSAMAQPLWHALPSEPARLAACQHRPDVVGL